MFGILKTYKDMKKGVRDPGGLGKELALDIIKVPLLLFTILGGMFLVFMFILAFTASLGGPYLFFKIVFILLTIPYALFQLIAWPIYRKLERLAEGAKNKINEKIVDGEVE